jgi:transcription-repair coupling factor (superfamily II helicase)
LERATKAIKNGKAPNLDAPLTLTSDISLHLPALIPDDYLNDVHQRLLFYKRISGADNEQELNDIRIEMIDRFGLLPQPARHLFDVHRLRLKAEQLGIEKMDMNVLGGVVEFRPDTPVDAMTMIQLIQSKPMLYKMEGGQRLRVKHNLPDVQERIKVVHELLDLLTPTHLKHADVVMHAPQMSTSTSKKRRR